ncbi:MAG: hypothetical protein EPN47_04580 [Acidobacteria bacterium]|nr:MAG: hypothetical protein EPN47_04580 [Acidobacteriota bacterium]
MRLCLLSTIAALAVFTPPSLRAQAIIAPGGRTLFNRESLVRSFVERLHLSIETPDGKFVDVTQYITPLAFVYAFAPKWQVIVVQPGVSASVTEGAGTESMTQHVPYCFADSQFILQYDGLYSRNAPGGLTRLSGIFGLEAPTGAVRFSTGAFGYTGGLVFEKVSRLRYAFTADFQYTIATENEAGLSQGNTAQYDVAPAYFIIPREQTPADASGFRRTFDRVFHNGAFAIVELNGTSQAQAFARGTGANPNSGGTALYVSPGIQYFVSRRFIAEFSVPIFGQNWERPFRWRNPLRFADGFSGFLQNLWDNGADRLAQRDVFLVPSERSASLLFPASAALFPPRVTGPGPQHLSTGYKVAWRRPRGG